MSFAIGGAVKLGSAIGFLRIDPSQFSKGLAATSKEIDRFYAASAKTANAAARKIASGLQAERAQAAQASATQGRLAQLQKSALQSSNLLATANANRAKSTQTYITAEQKAAQATVDAAAQKIAAEQRLSAAITERNRLQNLPTAGRGRFVKGGERLGAVIDRDLAAAEREVAAAQIAVTDAATAAARAQTLKTDADKLGVAAANENAVAAARNATALQALEAEYATLAAERRVTFAEFGAQTQTALNRAEAAGAREIATLQAVQRERDKLATRRIAAVGIGDDAKRAAELQKVGDAEFKLAQREQAVVASRISAERSLTTAVSSEVRTRIALVQEEAAAVVAAEAEEAAARQAIIAKTTGKLAGLAAKGFLAVGATVLVSTAAFVSFDQAMKNVFSIMNVSEAQMKSMTQTVRDLSVEFGKSPTELAAGLYEIAQAGFTANDATEILAVSTKAATAGLTTVESAAHPLIATLASFGTEAGSAQEVMDKLFVGVTAGIFTFDELSSQLGDNLALAHALKVPFDDLIASYIVLTKQGNSLSESTTQINSIMTQLLKPTDALTSLLQQMGFASGQALIEQEGLIGAVQKLQKEFGLTNDELAALFPNVRGLRGDIALLNVTEQDMAATQDQVAQSAGTMNDVFKIQSQAVALQLKKVRQELTGAAIDLGRGFAPALVDAANKVGALAQKFSELSPQMQHNISLFLLFGGGVTGLMLVLVKLGTAINESVKAIKEFIAVVDLAKVAAVTTGIGALVVVLGFLAEAYYRNKNANDANKAAQEAEQKRVNDLATSYSNLNDIIQNLALDKLFGPAATATATLTAIQTSASDVNTEFSDLAKTVADLRSKSGAIDPSMFAGSKEAADAASRQRDLINAKIDATIQRMTGLGDANVIAAQATDLLSKAARDQRVDIDAVSAGILNMITGWRDGVFTGKQVTDQLTFMSDNLSLWSKEVTDSTKKEEAKKKADEELVKAQDDLNKSIADLATGTIASLRGMEKDWVSWMSGVQGGMAKVGDSTAKIVNRMIRQTKGGLLKNLDPDLKHAVQLVRNLEKVEVSITRVQDAIATNASDISMWQGRIDLVTDSLGLNTDTITEWQRQLRDGEITQQTFNDNIQWLVSTEGLPRLQQLVNEGKITQEQADKIRKDSIFLLQRSAGGILDEEGATALQVSTLADYVRAHDDADGAVKTMTDDQIQFAAAMNSSQVQTFLQTLQLLAYLAAIGAIPPETVTKFEVAASVDPVVAAFMQDAGLMSKDGVVIPIDFTKAPGSLDPTKPFVWPSLFAPPDTSNVDKAKSDLEKQDPAKIPTVAVAPPAGAPGAGTGGTQQTTNAPAAPPAQTETATVAVNFDIDKVGKRSFDQIYTRANNWPDKVSTAFTFTGGTSGGGEAKGGGDNSAFTTTYNILKNKWPTDVSTKFTLHGRAGATGVFDDLTTGSAAAEANLAIVADQMKTTFIQIATDATNFGIAAGSGFKNGFRTEIVGVITIASVTAALLANALSGLSGSTYNSGFEAGAAFGQGMAIGISSKFDQVIATAYSLGLAASSATNQAISVKSPSKVTYLSGQMFGEGLIRGMRSKESEIAQQSTSLANAMSSGFTQGSFAPGLVTNPAKTPIGAHIISPSGHTNIVVHQAVTVPAANFPEWISTMDYVQKLDQGFSTTLASKRGR